MPATATMSRIADYFLIPFKRALAYSELLVKDIPPAMFAHMPHPTMNHPAFNIGHLSLYPNRILDLVGKPELIVEKPGFVELFQAGAACVEQDGRYPAKDEIVNYFFERYKTVEGELWTVSDEVFARENPVEARRAVFPTVGVAVNFLLNSHTMSHLGQVSAWRRAVGLPSVM